MYLVLTVKSHYFKLNEMDRKLHNELWFTILRKISKKNEIHVHVVWTSKSQHTQQLYIFKYLIKKLLQTWNISKSNLKLKHHLLYGLGHALSFGADRDIYGGIRGRGWGGWLQTVSRGGNFFWWCAMVQAKMMYVMKSIFDVISFVLLKEIDEY